MDIKKKDEMQLIIGHSGFIKTTEDLYEAMVDSVPGVKFGIGFVEASGPKLVRGEGNDKELKKLAEENALRIGAGHTFVILFKGAYPINVVKNIRDIVETANVYCATANSTQVVVGATAMGRSVLGVVDGGAARGIEKEKDRRYRRKFLRDLGYKL